MDKTLLKSRLQEIFVGETSTKNDAFLAVINRELDKAFPAETRIEELSASLQQFSRRLEKAYMENGVLNLELAKDLFHRAFALLRFASHHPAHEAVPFILVAVGYLVRQGDAVDDFLELDGFEDDRRVIDSVIEYFDLEKSIGLDGLQLA